MWTRSLEVHHPLAPMSQLEDVSVYPGIEQTWAFGQGVLGTRACEGWSRGAQCPLGTCRGKGHGQKTAMWTRGGASQAHMCVELPAQTQSLSPWAEAGLHAPTSATHPPGAVVDCPLRSRSMMHRAKAWVPLPGSQGDAGQKYQVQVKTEMWACHRELLTRNPSLVLPTCSPSLLYPRPLRTCAPSSFTNLQPLAP